MNELMIVDTSSSPPVSPVKFAVTKPRINSTSKQTKLNITLSIN